MIVVCKTFKADLLISQFTPSWAI
uniref:Uncharacterized protein n=1 Tax=Arundo donax TaxID=35708 RepID=A0A0A8ZIK7_ARUDO